MQGSEVEKSLPQQRRFDLIAGAPSLDFVNTLDDRYTTTPTESLVHYDDLVHFAEDTALIKPTHAKLLIKRGSQDPHHAREALRRAKDLREAIHDIFWAVIHQRSVPAQALAKLNAVLQKASEHLHLVQTDAAFDWRFDAPDHFDSVLWRMARSAADLLASDQLPLVRACSSETCMWFFLDTSKNHHRRWCDMKRCGNRAKVRNFYARQKSE
jgi:predicted RNA-binding Zn ribbon-like protein